MIVKFVCLHVAMFARWTQGQSVVSLCISRPRLVSQHLFSENSYVDKMKLSALRGVVLNQAGHQGYIFTRVG